MNRKYNGYTMMDFDNNTTHAKTDRGHSYKCMRGLWGVSCANKEAAKREALHYFTQYWADGEYLT